MTTDFDWIIDRSNSDSAKWAPPQKFLSLDGLSSDVIPMWVADMDFRAPPAVVEALSKYVRDGVFGCAYRTEGFEEAVCGWQKRRFGWNTKPEWLVQTPGIVMALNAVIQTFTRPGDAVLIQSPVYGHFYNDVLENGRKVIDVPLARGESSYSFDAEAFAAAITPETKLFILCNPHNPTGNVWSEADLRSMGEICLRHEILVVSDEIHQDLIFNPGVKHIPFAALGDAFAQNSIVCTAPSKTFNLAGLQCSNLFIPNALIRAEVQRTLLRGGIYAVNSIGAVACEAAYQNGEVWLEELLLYIRANHQHFRDSLRANCPKFRVFDTDALYLAWIDCRQLGLSDLELEHFMLTKAGVWWDRGSKFGQHGQGFMRANLGCSRTLIDKAIWRIREAITLPDANKAA